MQSNTMSSLASNSNNLILMIYWEYLIRPISLMGNVFANGRPDQGLIQWSSPIKPSKIGLDTCCFTLSIIWYVLRVKWSNPGKRVASSLCIGVVAIEKGAFWSLFFYFITEILIMFAFNCDSHCVRVFTQPTQPLVVIVLTFLLRRGTRPYERGTNCYTKSFI